MKKLTVFLGGTCGESTWRNKLLKKLNNKVEAFNPVVDNWTAECQAIEDEHKKNDDINLFVITPESHSTYSLFEIGVEAVKNPKRTVVCFLDGENGFYFDNHTTKSITKIKKDLKDLKVEVYDNLDDLAFNLNNYAEYISSKEETL